MYDIAYHEDASLELGSLRAFDRVRVLAAVDRNLRGAPLRLRGGKKRLDLEGGGFIYQLRVGEFRVFYDVDEDKRLVVVRHVRRKGRRTTGAVL